MLLAENNNVVANIAAENRLLANFVAGLNKINLITFLSFGYSALYSSREVQDHPADTVCIDSSFKMSIDKSTRLANSRHPVSTSPITEYNHVKRARSSAG